MKETTLINKPTLGVYQFVHNAVTYDYPFLESLASAIPIADQIVVCECESEDNTLKILEEFRERYKDKIKIVHHPWVKHFTELSIIGNYASTFLETDWKWQLQSDEVIHEDQYLNIEVWLYLVTKHNIKVSALTTKYIHFIATYFHTFPFCYSEIVRIYKKGSNWMLVGDACQLAGGNSEEVLNTDITVYHYGKVHEGKKGFKKEVDFQNLFRDIGFPDPRMEEMKNILGEEFCDYLYLFEDHVKKGNVKKFEGTHPSVMHNRIKQFQDNGYDQLVSRVKDGLKL